MAAEKVALVAQAVVRSETDAEKREYPPIAAFFYPRHAVEFVKKHTGYVAQTPSGRRITGTTSHGQAILETLREQGKV